jgi:hypothetical protein
MVAAAKPGAMESVTISDHDDDYRRNVLLRLVFNTIVNLTPDEQVVLSEPGAPTRRIVVIEVGYSRSSSFWRPSMSSASADVFASTVRRRQAGVSYRRATDDTLRAVNRSTRGRELDLMARIAA